MSSAESNPPPSQPKVITAAVPPLAAAMILAALLIFSAFAHWFVCEILSDAFPFHQDTIRRFTSASRGAFLFVCLFNWRALCRDVARVMREDDDSSCDCDTCSREPR